MVLSVGMARKVQVRDSQSVLEVLSGATLLAARHGMYEVSPLWVVRYLYSLPPVGEYLSSVSAFNPEVADALWGGNTWVKVGDPLPVSSSLLKAMKRAAKRGGGVEVPPLGGVRVRTVGMVMEALVDKHRGMRDMFRGYSGIQVGGAIDQIIARALGDVSRTSAVSPTQEPRGGDTNPQVQGTATAVSSSSGNDNIPTIPLPDDNKNGKLGTQFGVVGPYVHDMTAEACAGVYDSVAGRDPEIGTMVQVLSRHRKPNIILTGVAGVGKTAVVEGFAARVANGKVPPHLSGRTVIQLNISAMVAGTTLRGQFEERMTQFVEWWEEHPDVIVFVDEGHTLMGAGASSESSIDAVNLLKPVLARKGTSLILATTHDEYREFIRKDHAFTRRFAHLTIAEPSNNETVDILRSVKLSYEKHHAVSYPDEVIQFIVHASSRYYPERSQPDSAIELLDDAGAHASPHSPTTTATVPPDGTPPVQVSHDHVTHIIATRTGIPKNHISHTNLEELTTLYPLLTRHVIGQHEAVTETVSAISHARMGFRDPKRPEATLLFTGPSGVGKTFLCRHIATHIYGSEDHLFRVDCGEYTQPHQIARLIGAPAGYLGHNEGGTLTEHLRTHPRTLLLFDEIEKADNALHDMILGLMDNGIITDGQGNPASARHAIIILTSNLASGRGSGFHPDPNRLHEISHHFRPEFINRIDHIIQFNHLTRHDLEHIARTHLEHINTTLTAHQYSIHVTPEAVSHIATHSSHHTHGARALARYLTTHLTTPLTHLITTHTFPPHTQFVIDTPPPTATTPHLTITPRGVGVNLASDTVHTHAHSGEKP